MTNAPEGIIEINVRPFENGYNVKLTYPGGCEVSNHFQQRYLVYDWIDFLKIRRYEITWEPEQEPD